MSQEDINKIEDDWLKLIGLIKYDYISKKTFSVIEYPGRGPLFKILLNIEQKDLQFTSEIRGKKWEKMFKEDEVELLFASFFRNVQGNISMSNIMHDADPKYADDEGLKEFFKRDPESSFKDKEDYPKGTHGGLLKFKFFDGLSIYEPIIFDLEDCSTTENIPGRRNISGQYSIKRTKEFVLNKKNRTALILIMTYL